MKSKYSSATVAACALVMASGCDGFTFVAPNARRGTALQMGLFDGVKEAFSAPALERSEIDSERETPIDRWMGWSVKTEDEKVADQTAAANFIDSMDPTNYVSVTLTKPMGIVFEENDEKYGGIFVFELKEGGAADQNGSVKPGDQLISVGTNKVSGLPFDDALGVIVDSDESSPKLLLFRGSADDFYGPTGASQEWLDEFVATTGVVA
uniref:PDZ domain-containing protein n=1 Tax=Trieres chinensis TaxID=1514140 RepID=A0A6U1TN17_TRICV|mmetsp:Transcript_17371/g.35627  ORF Transcript_17371/g.35627 Transcript_17371/m.35627 type:complete len:209 (+) Transcript_17371:186-812(+)